MAVRDRRKPHSPAPPRRGSRTAGPGRAGPDPVAESFTDSADARLAAGAASRALAAAIASLDPGQRDVLLLITWAGLTYDQVAETLGVPEGTVRSRMNRARVRLRAALGGANPASTADER